MLKRIFWSWVLMCLLTIPSVADENAVDIKVMSYNIRYNNPNDGVNAWPNRKDHVAEMIGKVYAVDFAGLQEALIGQIHDLEERLPKYAWIGVGRNDGKEKGEFSPIFYLKDRFELLEHNTFWLSETPDKIGSQSWDAALPRIVTWGKFKEKASGKVFYIFNTHFDHRGKKARLESAKIIVAKSAEIAGDSPSLITGDFNLRENNDSYAVLTGQGSDLKDARYVSKTPHKGPTATFTINNWTGHGPPETKIDYIFIRKGVTVKKHAVLTDKYDGRFPSDHLPVLVHATIK